MKVTELRENIKEQEETRRSWRERTITVGKRHLGNEWGRKEAKDSDGMIKQNKVCWLSKREGKPLGCQCCARVNALARFWTGSTGLRGEAASVLSADHVPYSRW